MSFPYNDEAPVNPLELSPFTADQRDLLANVNITVYDGSGPKPTFFRMSLLEFIKFPTGLTINGSSVLALGIATSTSANALAIGPNGATNPSIQVDASTASAATGVKIKSAAAAGGVAIVAISSGTNENMTLDAKGSGTILLNGTATGAVLVGDATTPAFSVVHTTEGTGVNITSAAAASGVAIAAISSGTNEALTVDAKGSGLLTLNGTGTGNVVIGHGLMGSVQALSGAGAVDLVTTTTKITSTGANALTLADGAPGQIKTLVMIVDGGDATLTPTTKTGFSTITFNDIGDGCILQFFTTVGWICIGNNGCTIA